MIYNKSRTLYLLKFSWFIIYDKGESYKLIINIYYCLRDFSSMTAYSCLNLNHPTIHNIDDNWTSVLGDQAITVSISYPIRFVSS